MTDNLQKPDPIETMLVDMRRAEKARVFTRTPVDPRSMVAAARPALFARRTRRITGILAAAAVVALSVGLWSLMPRHQNMPGGILRGASSGVASDPCDGSFVRCFSGPAPVALASRCLTHDYDADGDVDLSDYRDYQIHCNRPPSATP